MNTETRRLSPQDRKKEILVAAVVIAEREGLQELRRDKVAKEANASDGLVSRYFNTMGQLKHAVVRYAVQNRILPVIAQGLAIKDSEALKASEELQKEALASLTA